MFSSKKIFYSSKQNKPNINYIKSEYLEDEGLQTNTLDSSSTGEQAFFSRDGNYLVYRIGERFVLKKYTPSELSWKTIAAGCCTLYDYGWGDTCVSNSGTVITSSNLLIDSGGWPGSAGTIQDASLLKHIFNEQQGFYLPAVTIANANQLNGYPEFIDSSESIVSINDNDEIAFVSPNGVRVPSFGISINYSKNFTTSYEGNGVPKSKFARKSSFTNNFFCYSYLEDSSTNVYLHKKTSGGSDQVGTINLNGYVSYLKITEDESKTIIVLKSLSSSSHSILIVENNSFSYIATKNITATTEFVGCNSSGTDIILFDRHRKEFIILNQNLETIGQSIFNELPKIDNSPSLGETPYYAIGYSSSNETISFITGESIIGDFVLKTHIFKRENYDNNNKSIQKLEEPPEEERTLPTPQIDITRLVFGMYDDPSLDLSSRSTFGKNTWYYVGDYEYNSTTNYRLYSPARRLKFRLINKRGATDHPINLTISVTYRGQTSTANLSFVNQEYLDFDLKIPFNHDFEINQNTFDQFIYINRSSSSASIYDYDHIWANAVPDSEYENDLDNVEVSIICEDYFDIEYDNTYQHPDTPYEGHSLYLESIDQWGNLSNPPKLKTDGIYTYNYPKEEREINKPLSALPSTLPSVFDSLSRLFEDSKFNSDISSWDVSNIKDFSNLFLNSDFNQPINNWNVSGGINFENMFKNSNFNQNISGWDISSSARNMKSMFESSSFNQNISNWNVSSVTNMSSMFKNSIFNQNIGGWNTSNCSNMEEMFSGNSVFNQSLNNWNVEKLCHLREIFKNASSFNQSLSNWKLRFLCSSPENFAINTSIDSANYQETIIGWSESFLGGMGSTFDFSPAVPDSNSSNYLEYIAAKNLLSDKNIYIRNGESL